LSRARVRYVCQQCGRAAAKPLGRCPQCGAWNSMVAESISPARPGPAPARHGGTRVPRRVVDIEGDPEQRLPLPIGEFARVLGGGVVPGSLVLIGGEPGIGKSTLLTQMSAAMAGSDAVLYVSGEESERQIKARLLRLTPGDTIPESLYLLTETDLAGILTHIEALAPHLVVIDSIQTVHVPGIGQADRHCGFPGRPCDQGGGDRRAACPRAHR
jgi:DNA repair protein RadA/Sms